MYQSARRSALRTGRAVRRPCLRAAPRRFASTAPTARKGTWRGTMVRWGLAMSAVYWYNTSPIFADEFEPRPTSRVLASEDDAATVDAVIETKRREMAASRPPTTAASQSAKSNDADAAEAGKKVETEKLEGQPVTAQGIRTDATDGIRVPGSPEGLEEEADQQGAFNPETGEINWDCPCLGGMAHGPCGEEFKAAFSCFVFSEMEPKGMDCIDKFQHMQDCFRKYPEVYGAELQEDEAGVEQGDSPEGAMAKTADQTTASSASDGPLESSKEEKAEKNTSGSAKKAPADHDEKQKSRNSYGEVPTKAYDATTASKDAKKEDKP